MPLYQERRRLQKPLQFRQAPRVHNRHPQQAAPVRTLTRVTRHLPHAASFRMALIPASTQRNPGRDPALLTNPSSVTLVRGSTQQCGALHALHRHFTAASIQALLERPTIVLYREAEPAQWRPGHGDALPSADPVDFADPAHAGRAVMHVGRLVPDIPSRQFPRVIGAHVVGSAGSPTTDATGA